MLNPQYILYANMYSKSNSAWIKLENSKTASCYNCIKKFKKSVIKVKKLEPIFCPYCGVDSVLLDEALGNGFYKNLNDEDLLEIKKYWFGNSNQPGYASCLNGKLYAFAPGVVLLDNGKVKEIGYITSEQKNAQLIFKVVFNYGEDFEDVFYYQTQPNGIPTYLSSSISNNQKAYIKELYNEYLVINNTSTISPFILAVIEKYTFVEMGFE